MAGVTAQGPRWLAEAVLASYAQVFFSDSRLAGLALLALTWWRPWAGLLGLTGVLLALGTVRALHFNLESAGRGLFGFNALFLGLAVATWFEPGPAPLLALGLGVVAVVFAQVVLETALGFHLALPALSLPFVVVAHLTLLAAPAFPGLAPAAPVLTLPPTALASVGAIFFLPSTLAGGLVLAAIVLSSRIAAVLVGVGLAAAALVLAVVEPTAVSAALVGANSLLVALALGGIWFVPQRSAFALAFGGALLAALATVGLTSLLVPMGLPVLVLPFNLTVLVVVYAMRQRLRDAAPKAVDFIAGSPEVNLSYYRTRVARFGAQLATRLALPFSGRWTVTQGVNGAHTHAGLWRHALDFEVLDAEGRAHRGAGTELRDYACYRLPVLAPADGRVVKVVRDVPDNPPGHRNADDNWGNLVLIQHSVRLYSLVCHLAPGSVDVTEGQQVRQGMRLGLCGNSGRSFVPHVHLQLQASSRVGAPTVELELHDVVEETPGGDRLQRASTPREGAKVRNLERRDDVARLLDLKPGSTWRFEVDDGRGHTRQETVTAGIDLFNNLFLQSSRGQRLWYESQARQFIAFDFQGPRDGALYLLFAALLRVPFEAGVGWDDVLPRRHLRPRAFGWVGDLLSPFLGADEVLVRFHAERTAAGLEVRGEADGLSTFALVQALGPAELRLTARGVTRRARLLESAP
ncbi:MAG: urea transporter [Archangium sp.]|nr:urea transporter [Archangium sp.]